MVPKTTDYLFAIPPRYGPLQLKAKRKAPSDDILAPSLHQSQHEGTEAQPVVSQPEEYEKPDEIYQSFIDSFPPDDYYNYHVVKVWVASWFKANDIFDFDIGVHQYASNSPLNGRFVRGLNDRCIRECLNMMNVEIDQKTKLYPQSVIDELIKCVLWTRSIHAEKKHIEDENRKVAYEMVMADMEEKGIEAETKLTEEKQKGGEDDKKRHDLNVTLPQATLNTYPQNRLPEAVEIQSGTGAIHKITQSQSQQDHLETWMEVGRGRERLRQEEIAEILASANKKV